MQYKLNKVDMEIRQKVKDVTKDGIVHRQNEIILQKEQSDKKKKNKYSKEEHKEHNSQETTKTIVVEAKKYLIYEPIEIQVSREFQDESSIKKGVLLDTRK